MLVTLLSWIVEIYNGLFTSTSVLKTFTTYDELFSKLMKDSRFTNIVAIILAMFRWVGIVLLVWGVAQFIMAIKRTDAESKSDAIQTIICSIVLISLKSVIEGLGIDGLTIGNADI